MNRKNRPFIWNAVLASTHTVLISTSSFEPSVIENSRKGPVKGCSTGTRLLKSRSFLDMSLWLTTPMAHLFLHIRSLESAHTNTFLYNPNPH